MIRLQPFIYKECSFRFDALKGLMEKLKNKRLAILSLGLLSALGPFSIDMYLPGFNDMAHSLKTTVPEIGLSLSSFFVGISIGQLIYGPLLDRYGRKKPLYVGLAIYFFTTLACTMVKNVDQLIVLRFFEALGSCAGMVAARALVRDLFPVNKIAKVFSYLMLVIALSPVLAPTFGGYISTWFGWPSIFMTLAGIGLLTLIVSWLWLPDGNRPDDEKSLRPLPIIRSYLEVAGVPQFYIFASISAISFSGLYAYISGSADLFLNVYHVSQKEYGLIFAIISLGMTFTGQLNTLFLNKFTSEQISFTALIIQAFLATVLLVLITWNVIGLYSMITMICVYLAALGFVFPNTSALCLTAFSRNAGTASALMGSVQLGIGAIVAGIVNMIPNHNGRPMAMIMLICTLFSLAIFIYSKKTNLLKSGEKTIFLDV